jgi:hypothetical protein
LPALFCAALTFVGAALAVIVLMFTAFSPACVANFSTKPTDFTRETGAATHPRRGRPTDFRAVFVEANALGHHLDVRFAETSVAAVFTSLGTTDTSLDARLELFVKHRTLSD